MGKRAPMHDKAASASMQRAAQALVDATHQDVDDPQLRLGAQVYATACAACHDLGRRMGSDGALRLPLAVALYERDPRSFLRIVREGIAPRDGEIGRWMPSYGQALTDPQLSALAAYLRRHAAAQAPWPDLDKAVAGSRAATGTSARKPAASGAGKAGRDADRN